MNLKKKTFRLHNPKYYIRIFLKIQKFMEVREERIKVQEEPVFKQII